MQLLVMLIISFITFKYNVEACYPSVSGFEIEEIASALNQFQDDWKVSEVDNRIYIKPEAIFFSYNQLYLAAGPLTVPVPSIHCDANGYFVCREGWLFWYCCRCGSHNGYSWNTCANCGKCRCE